MSKTVLITGCSTGIGKTTAKYFQQKGWNVLATMRKPEEEQELNHLDRVKCLPLDVTDEISIQKAIEESIKYFGEIDVIVNNAGYGTVGAFEAASQAQIKRQFDTNVFGIMNVTRAILPYFREKKGGTIINVTSMAGKLSFPLYSLYNATKFAVEGFTESLTYELKQFNIKLRLIEPGVIKTDFYSRSQDLFKKEGLTVYENYQNKAYPNLQAKEKNAPGPEVVAKAIYKAAIAQGNKLRYPVGNNAPFFLFLRKMIPDSWYFAIVRSQIE